MTDPPRTSGSTQPVAKRRRAGLHEAGPGALRPEVVNSLVGLALGEDLGTGDLTSLHTVAETTRARAHIFAKQEGVLSGLVPAREAARLVDPEMTFTAECQDGDPFQPGTTVLRLAGSARSLLAVERVLLNFLQQLSGVATLTRRYVRAVEGTGVTIVDTRKTTPGLRFLEKAAVRHGGGGNHRMGLYDAYMIKDNHIVAAGGIEKAVRGVRDTGPRHFLVVEVRTPEEVMEVASLGVDQILLDNMDPPAITRSVRTIRECESAHGLPAAWIEVSGGIDLQTVRSKALPGVDLISVGALTHSAPAVDLSMDLELR